MRNSFFKSTAKRALCIGLTAVLSLSMVGCKPTDFFVEKIITPSAEDVDENNENTIMINSPDAEQETEALAALDWTDDSVQSEDVQNLVTWSDSPTSTMTTHHSIYDDAAHFPDILASDGVRLMLNANADLQGDVDGDEDVDDEEVTSTGSGNSSKTSTDPNAATSENSDMTTSGDTATSEGADNGSETGDSKGNNGSSSNSGSNAGGDTEGGEEGEGEGEGAGEDPSEEPGREPDYAGYGGEVKVFDPNSALEEPPRVNSIGVIGQQAAVLVEALGGSGAINSMSAFDYNNTSINTSLNFAAVFSGEIDVGNTYFWGASSSADLSQMDAAQIVEKCGYDGLIIYDKNTFENESELNEALPEAVKLETYGYNIKFMIVDFDTVESMKQSAELIGKALSESADLAEGWDSVNMAANYTDTIESFEKDLKSATGVTSNHYVSLATDAVEKARISFTEKSSSLTNQLLLFADYRQDAKNGDSSLKPLGSWARAAGVNIVTEGDGSSSIDTAAARGSTALMFPFLEIGFTVDSSASGITTWKRYSKINQMVKAGNTSDIGAGSEDGIGSESVPYLVVTGSADGELSAEKVEELAEDSILSYQDTAKKTSLYSAYKSGDVSADAPSDHSFIGDSFSGGNVLIGSTFDETESRVKGVVRDNPLGALGSWTDSSFESLLETVWIAALYSEKPFSGSLYTPKSNWENVTVTVGDGTVRGQSSASSSAQNIIRKFYQTFYRYDYCPAMDL